MILADEPTGNLDVDTAAGIVKIFKELAHEDKKCVIAVHIRKHLPRRQMWWYGWKRKNCRIKHEGEGKFL